MEFNIRAIPVYLENGELEGYDTERYEIEDKEVIEEIASLIIGEFDFENNEQNKKALSNFINDFDLLDELAKEYEDALDDFAHDRYWLDRA